LPPIEELAELWKTHTTDEIGAMFHRSGQSIRILLRSRGYESPRPSGQRTGLGAKYPDDETLWKMVATMTAKQMAAELGVPYYGLTTYLSQRKIGRRQLKQAAPVAPTPPESTPMSRPEPQPDALASHAESLQSTE
jgi:hypothetical protein